MPDLDRARAAARWSRLALLILLLVGATLRLLQYAANRSLWLDEALIASSILGRDIAGLAEPLDYGQTAPYGFLILARAAVDVFGTGEHALRLVPLLAGVGALLLFPFVARRYVSRSARPLAVAIFALAPYLIYYSSELKQYALDVLVAVAVIWVCAGLRTRSIHPVAAAAVGAAGVWLSQPAVFVLAGAGLALGVPALRRREWPRVGALALTGAAWAASFAGSYAVSRRSLGDPEYMAAFWRRGFLPELPWSGADWLWLPGRVWRMMREPVGVVGMDPFPPLGSFQAAAALLLLLAGTVWMWKRRPAALAILGLPFLLMVGASVVRLYPFGAHYLTSGRVLMFLFPAMALLMAEGAVRLWRWRPPLPAALPRSAAALASVLVLAPSLAYAAVGVPHLREESRPLLEYAAQERQPGDLLYVYYNGRAQYRYYAERYGWDPADTRFGICSRLRPGAYIADLGTLVGSPRVWFLFVNGSAAEGYNERLLMLRFLEHVGTRLDDQVSVGASLYLYDLSQRDPAALPPFSARVPEFEYDLAMDCRGPWAER